jgi:hypothetical protein
VDAHRPEPLDRLVHERPRLVQVTFESLDLTARHRDERRHVWPRVPGFDRIEVLRERRGICRPVQERRDLQGERP